MGRRESPAEAWERMRSASPSSSTPAPSWDPPPTPQSAPPPPQSAPPPPQSSPPPPQSSPPPPQSAPPPPQSPPPPPQSPPTAAQEAPAPERGSRDDAGAAPSDWDRVPAQTHEGSNGHSGSDLQDASAGDLVHRLTDQTKTLVKQEMRLAQVELKEKGKKAGIGIGMFGAGGLAAFFGVSVLLAAIVLALSTVVDAWLAALIVAVVLLAVAGVSALMGKKKIEEATPPAPEQAVDSVKRDVDEVKSRVRT